MRILCINNDGAGFADYIDIEEGTSVREFFESHVKNPDPSSYLIRVNRQPVTRDQRLQEGDRSSITPVKIEGAFRSFR